MGDGMDVIGHGPYRIWRCPVCGNPSGRAGHIGPECAGAEPVEYVRADTTRGAVEALRVALDAMKRSADDHNCDYCRADVATVEGELDRLGGQ